MANYAPAARPWMRACPAVRGPGRLHGSAIEPLPPHASHAADPPQAAHAPEPRHPKQTGAPPHWNNYVTVVNADESVKKAQSLGAKVFAPPFDVMDVGRMAVLQDPTGAALAVLKPFPTQK